MELVNVKEDNRELVNSFIRDHWCTTEMALRGKLIDMTLVDGIMALDGKRNITGLVTYMIRNAICEITSLDSLEENRGTGTTLVQEVIRIAKEQKCGKIEVITTNDNINACDFIRREVLTWRAFIIIP
ncbi:MAG: GNAT family N-acetyltransferase [Eisenbergiella sp.]